MRSTPVTGRRSAWTAAALACAAIGIAFLALACRSGGSAGPLNAEKVLADASKALTDPGEGGLSSYAGTARISSDPRTEYNVPVEPASGTVRFAYEAPGRYRFESVAETPAIESGERLLFVADGDTAWMYNSQLMQYSELRAGSLAYIQYRFNPALYFGGDLVQVLSSFEMQSGISAEMTGEDTVLGRDAYVIEVSPIFTERSDSTDGGTPVEHTSGVMRLWIDKENLFMLRMETPRGPDEGNLRFEYTSIEFNSDVPDSDFQFQPPSGAREVVAEETSSGSSHVVPGQFGEGFLDPAYRPIGYTPAGGGSSSSSNDEPLEAFASLKSSSNYVLIRQRVRRDGMPDALRAGNAVDVNGHEAWLDESATPRSLAWQQGDIVIQITADALPADELLRIARSIPAAP